MMIKIENKSSTMKKPRKFCDKNVSRANEKGVFTLDCNWEQQVICGFGILAKELLSNFASSFIY